MERIWKSARTLTTLLLLSACSHSGIGRAPNQAATLPMERDDSKRIQGILSRAGFVKGLSQEENIRAWNVECNRDRYDLPSKEEKRNPLECQAENQVPRMRKLSILATDSGMLFAIMQKYTSLQDYPGAIYIKLQKITCNRDEVNSVCEVELP